MIKALKMVNPKPQKFSRPGRFILTISVDFALLAARKREISRHPFQA